RHLVFMMTHENDIPVDIVELAREHTKAAIAVLVEIMACADAPTGVRVSAAKTLLERGWGKAGTQPRQEESCAAPATRPEKAIVNFSGPERDNPSQRFSAPCDMDGQPAHAGPATASPAVRSGPAPAGCVLPERAKHRKTRLSLPRARTGFVLTGQHCRSRRRDDLAMTSGMDALIGAFQSAFWRKMLRLHRLGETGRPC
ncbi:MAG TPA: hypothetical protein VH189_03385, partial [Rhizomicrobium sp.]|nr:hypothetical protein [Rhizomicrobium sp.]